MEFHLFSLIRYDYFAIFVREIYNKIQKKLKVYKSDKVIVWYYELNKNKMLKPLQVAEKIVQMIFDVKHHKNGAIVDMYNDI